MSTHPSASSAPARPLGVPYCRLCQFRDAEDERKVREAAEEQLALPPGMSRCLACRLRAETDDRWIRREMERRSELWNALTLDERARRKGLVLAR